MLGCDGFNSIVARRTGLYEHDPKHWLVALRCYYEGVEGLTDELELHFVDEVRPGYFWIFPLEDGTANIGIGMLQSVMKRKTHSFGTAEFRHDGNQIYVAADLDGEFRQLYAIPFGTDAPTTATLLTGDISWDVTSIVASSIVRYAQRAIR